MNGAMPFSKSSTIVDKTPGVDGDEVVVGVTTPETKLLHATHVILVSLFTDPITEVKAAATAGIKCQRKVRNTRLILSLVTWVYYNNPVEWRGSTLAEALQTTTLKGKRMYSSWWSLATLLLTKTYGDNVTANQSGSYLNTMAASFIVLTVSCQLYACDFTRRSYQEELSS